MQQFIHGIIASAALGMALTAQTAEKNDSSDLSQAATLKLAAVAFFVEDVPRTVDFYAAAFGLALKFMHPSKGYAELTTGSTTMAFVSEHFIEEQHLFADTKLRLNRAASDPIAAQVAFISQDIARDWSRAVNAGARVLKSPEPKPWGQTVGYLFDLNGVIVELCTPPTRQ